MRNTMRNCAQNSHKWYVYVVWLQTVPFLLAVPVVQKFHCHSKSRNMIFLHWKSKLERRRPTWWHGLQTSLRLSEPKTINSFAYQASVHLWLLNALLFTYTYQIIVDNFKFQVENVHQNVCDRALNCIDFFLLGLKSVCCTESHTKEWKKIAERLKTTPKTRRKKC